MLTQSDTYNGITLTSGYNAAGDRASLADSKGGNLVSTFDAKHQLSSRSQSAIGVRVEYSYDFNGDRGEARRYNATAGGALVGSTKYGYDSARRPTNENQMVGAVAVMTYVDSYDGAGRVQAETRNGTVRTFGYDATSQVTSDSGTGSVFTYDQNGNRTTAGYSTGVANRLATDGSWNYTYDWEGNVSSKTRISDNHYWSYGYDLNNQMTQAVERITAGGSIVQTVLYKYDVYGDLVSRTVGGAVTRYAFEITDNSPGFAASVNSLWAELNNAGAVTLRYLTVGDETVARSDGTNLYWLLADRQGSTRDVTNAAGAFVGHVEYTTFGGLLSESNAAVSGNVLFTGDLYDRLTGLYGMHWRSYDPQGGQWTSEDPLGFAAGDMNQRRYVGNGATNGVDRNGLEDNPSWLERGAGWVDRRVDDANKVVDSAVRMASPGIRQTTRDLDRKLEKIEENRRDKMKRNIPESVTKNSIALMYMLATAPGNNIPRSVALEEFNKIVFLWDQEDVLFTMLKSGEGPSPKELAMISVVGVSYKNGSHATTLPLGQRGDAPTIFFKHECIAFDKSGQISGKAELSAFALIAHEMQHAVQIFKLQSQGKIFLSDYLSEYTDLMLKSNFDGESSYKNITFEKEASIWSRIMPEIFDDPKMVAIFNRLAAQPGWAEG